MDEIVSAFEHLSGGWEFFVQLTSSYHLKIDGATATANFYENEIARIKDGSSNFNLSIYKDTLVFKNDQYNFEERNFNVLHLDKTQ